MFADDCEDLAYEIAFWMQGLEDPAPALDEHADLIRQLCPQLRSLAIMVLLAFGKTDRFHHNLIRSARLRLAFLERCRQEGATDAHDCVSGVLEPLHDAMAAGDWALASSLTAAAPPDYRAGHEYEDDFCYARLLQLLVDGGSDAQAQARLADRMEQALGDPDHPRLAVCRALGSRDQPAFEAAFEALLELRTTEIEGDVQRCELAEPPVLAQRQVFVEGLALLGLAQRLGLETDPDYRYCPALARVPMRTPVPADD